MYLPLLWVLFECEDHSLALRNDFLLVLLGQLLPQLDDVLQRLEGKGGVDLNQVRVGQDEGGRPEAMGCHVSDWWSNPLSLRHHSLGLQDCKRALSDTTQRGTRLHPALSRISAPTQLKM